MPAAACSLCSPDRTTVLTNKQVEHGQMQNWIRSVCILDVRRDPCHGHGQLVMHSLAGDDRDQTTVLLHVMGGPQCKQPLLVADNSFIPPNPHHHIYRMHECPRHLGSWNSSSTSSCRGVVLTPLQAQATPTHACMRACCHMTCWCLWCRALSICPRWCLWWASCKMRSPLRSTNVQSCDMANWCPLTYSLQMFWVFLIHNFC